MPSLGMIIGFTSRSQTVSEGDAPPGSDFNVLTIDIATERTSERAYTILFDHSYRNIFTAIVESYVIQHNPLFDALFGNEDNYIKFILQPGASEIPSLITSVRNDIRPEDDECYTISFYGRYVLHRSYYCNYNDNDMADNYFCDHTICITNDDGIFLYCIVSLRFTYLLSFRTVCRCICANNVHCC